MESIITTDLGVMFAQPRACGEIETGCRPVIAMIYKKIKILI
jgi:hypothetical protein